MLLGHPPSEVMHTRAEVGTFYEIDATVVAEALGLDAARKAGDPEGSISLRDELAPLLDPAARVPTGL